MASKEEQVLKSPSEPSEPQCDFCCEESKHVEAVGFCVDCGDNLCGECFRIHRRTRLTRNHELQDLDRTVTRTQQTNPVLEEPLTSTSIVKPDIKVSPETCERHEGMIIQFYCRHHESLCCYSCVQTEHSSCHVSPVQKLANLMSSTEVPTFLADLSSLQSRSQQVIQAATESITTAEKCCTDVKESLDKLRTDMNSAFDQMERFVVGASEKAKAHDTLSMNSVIRKAEQFLSEVDKSIASVQILQSRGAIDQVFIHMTKHGDKRSTLSDQLEELEGKQLEYTYTFKPGDELKQVIDNPAGMGNIRMTGTQYQ